MGEGGGVEFLSFSGKRTFTTKKTTKKKGRKKKRKPRKRRAPSKLKATIEASGVGRYVLQVGRQKPRGHAAKGKTSLGGDSKKPMEASSNTLETAFGSRMNPHMRYGHALGLSIPNNPYNKSSVRSIEDISKKIDNMETRITAERRQDAPRRIRQAGETPSRRQRSEARINAERSAQTTPQNLQMVVRRDDEGAPAGGGGEGVMREVHRQQGYQPAYQRMSSVEYDRYAQGAAGQHKVSVTGVEGTEAKTYKRPARKETVRHHLAAAQEQFKGDPQVEVGGYTSEEKKAKGVAERVIAGAPTKQLGVRRAQTLGVYPTASPKKLEELVKSRVIGERTADITRYEKGKKGPVTKPDWIPEPSIGHDVYRSGRTGQLFKEVRGGGHTPYRPFAADGGGGGGEERRVVQPATPPVAAMSFPQVSTGTSSE